MTDETKKKAGYRGENEALRRENEELRREVAFLRDVVAAYHALERRMAEMTRGQRRRESSTIEGASS